MVWWICNVAASRRKMGMKRVSKQFNPASIGHKGEGRGGNILFTISLPLEKMSFLGRSESHTQCQSELEQSIQMSFMSPEQLWSSVEIVDQQVFGIKQLCLVVGLFS